MSIDAVAQWGIKNQLHILAEECSELAVAASHVARERDDSVLEIVEEIADVEIMIDQIKNHFSLSEKVMIKKDEKLKRLKKRIEDEVP